MRGSCIGFLRRLWPPAASPNGRSDRQGDSPAPPSHADLETVSLQDIVIKHTEPLRVAESRGVAAGLSPEHIGAVFLQLSPRLLGHIQQAGAHPGTLVQYYDEPAGDGSVEVHIAYEIGSQSVPSAEAIQIVELAVIEVASVLHRGGMENIVATYQGLLGWIESHGLLVAGYGRELYHEMGEDGPHVTEIQVPIRRSPGNPSHPN